MDLKQIRESTQVLRSTDVSKLDPRAISEGFSQMQSLHREASALVATDPKMSWDGSRIHGELDALEKSWMESVQAPASNVVKLQEQQTRTLKVLRETATVGVKLREQLTDAMKTVEKKKTLVTEVAKRGNGWRERCLKAEALVRDTNGKLDLALESLDQYTIRYHEDTARLARHAVMLEFKGKIEADAGLLKRLNEARRVEEVQQVKADLTKPATPAPAAAPVAESKTTPAPTPAPAATPATVPAPVSATNAPNVRVESMVRPFNIAESIAMTTRLSQASEALLS